MHLSSHTHPAATTTCFVTPPLLTYDQWKDWGINRPTNLSLYTQATCGDFKLSVKIALNLDDEPNPDPDARDPDAIYDHDDSTIELASHRRVAQRFLDLTKTTCKILKGL
ncbi:hypothetical protein HGRIS_007263 [Hohenbuehelia grisea]|uniref:Uncharacterized protein n=1 Tax=Hohenbuehelia grisea TaxID=104357 RepID=A0ABR3JCB3_9AGAR